MNAIIPRPGFQGAEKGDGKSPLGFELFQDIGQADLFLHSLLILLGNHGGDVFGFCIGILRVAQRIVDSLGMDAVHIRVEKRTFLRFNVVDQPDRIVVVGQRFDDGVAGCRAHLLLFAFFRNVRYKYDVDPAVGLRLRIVAVVVHPPDRAVLANDAVFRVVQLVIAGFDLLNDGRADSVVILRMHHAAEGEAGQGPEFLLVCAAVDIEYGFVGVNQRLGFLCPIDEKAPGHVPANFPDDGNGIVVQLKALVCHVGHPPVGDRSHSLYQTHY